MVQGIWRALGSALRAAKIFDPQDTSPPLFDILDTCTIIYHTSYHLGREGSGFRGSSSVALGAEDVSPQDPQSRDTFCTLHPHVFNIQVGDVWLLKRIEHRVLF